MKLCKVEIIIVKKLHIHYYEIMKDLVSIIMNCHNGNRYVNKSIMSVFNQTYKNWELIFWDNASTEKSVVKHTYKNCKKIKYFYNPQFTNLGEARNLAIANAKGCFIAFLDVDDYWEPDKLEKQILLFKDPKVALTYTNSSVFNNKKFIKKSFNISNLPSGNIFRQMLSKYFIVMSSVILKREVLKRLNLKFNSNYEIIEEYDLFLRIAYFYKIGVETSVLTHWRWNGEGTTAKKRNLITKEKRLLLKSLRKDFPSFESKYKKEMSYVKNKIFLSLAINIYYSGNSKKCRKLLLKSNKLNLKGIVIFILSYFKPRLATLLYENIKGNPLV